MAFHPGDKKPETSGRKPGTPNKRTNELKALLAELGIDPVKKVIALLPSLNDKEKVDIYMKLLEYIYPKRKAIESDGQEGALPGITLTPEQFREYTQAMIAARRGK